ncbi:MAG: GAF domain-containing protein [Anaerolineales bacterium]|nr:GAF domain-containing protein [Anaerolineales bacterium]
MIARALNFIRSEDDRDPTFILLTRNILLFVMATNILVLPLVSGILDQNSKNPIAFQVLLVTFALQLISLFYIFRGNVYPTKVVVPLSLIIAIDAMALTTNGLKSSSILGLPLILMASVVLLGRRAVFTITPLIILSTAVIAYFDIRRVIRYIPTGLDDAIIIPILILGCSALIQLLTGRLNETIRKVRESETNYLVKNQALAELQTTLERKVEERTLALEDATRHSEQRARQFEAIAQVSSIISNIQDSETLISSITQVISEQFGHYHTGIFLLDETREFAVLRAANSPGGRRMLARNHKLQVGQSGIVGYVTATGNPRIALDVGADAVFFDNPDLPNTRSEIALPLQISGETIGALDVQSEAEKAFSYEDIAVLGTLANQVSVAIQNTRAIEETRKALAEAQSSYSESVLEAWKVMRPQSLGNGLQWAEGKIKPLESQERGNLAKGVVLSAGKLSMPVRMREQVIGAITLNRKTDVDWSDDDVEIASAVVDRLSLAIETATLLRATQQRADIERVTTEITSKISASSQFDAILQTAAQELSKALGGSDVLVQIEPSVLNPASAEQN